MNSDPFAPLTPPRFNSPTLSRSKLPIILLNRSSNHFEGIKQLPSVITLMEEAVMGGGGNGVDKVEFTESVEPSAAVTFNQYSSTLPTTYRETNSIETKGKEEETIPLFEIPERILHSAPKKDHSIIQGYSSSNQSNTTSPRTSPKVGYSSSRTSSPIQHQTRYSVGTHQLLSSRISVTTRIGNLFNSTTSWLILYFCFNLGLTLFNKLVLQGFPFPWTLTGIQMLSGTIGTQIALERGFFVKSKLTNREGAVMVAFSILYSINIAVSNLSLHLVTVPFHQVVRAMTPLFTMALSAALFQKRYSSATYISLLPVMIGVVFATYGDYYFTTWGLILTLFGTLLAALKTIVTNRIQVGRLKLHPLDLLIRMSPLAFVQCVFCAYWSGELERVRIYGATEMNSKKAIALGVNGLIAFGLNVVSFTANKKTSPLTMTVAANVKQVLTIILAVVIFHISLNITNVIGIILTLSGGAWYARVEYVEKLKIAQLKISTEASEKIMR